MGDAKVGEIDGAALENLVAVKHCFKNNRLKLKTDKTHYMVCTLRRTQTNKQNFWVLLSIRAWTGSWTSHWWCLQNVAEGHFLGCGDPGQAWQRPTVYHSHLFWHNVGHGHGYDTCLRLHKAVLQAIAAGGDSLTSPGTYRLTGTPAMAWTSFNHLPADLKNLDKRT